ncbi:replication initiation factor domain-containing protein [Enterococcus sp. LJL128]|uniref:replication initiation factor domain-containing protein n=1 Tax=Enterococcus sp. LJL51 TaxID=3416656 RepID=UPI003CE7DDF6
MKNYEEIFASGGSSNTPLHSTSRNPLEACVDWFSVTFKGNIFSNGLCDMLHLSVDDFECKKLADSNEYEYMYKFENFITVMIRNDNPQGTKKALTHLDVKGQGCRFLENNWKGLTWIDFFNLIKSAFTIHHITRLDVAIDDYVNCLNINTLHRKMRQKHFRSSAGTRSWRYIENGDMQHKSEISGQTLYIGKGDVEFRFYDKLAQLVNSQGVDLDKSIDFWNRYEIQLRQERAQVVMNMVAAGNLEIGELAKSIMAEYLAFLIPNKSDSNKSRWKVCDFWSNFLGEVKGVRLTMQPLEKSVYRTRSWVESQVSVSMAILEDCFGSQFVTNIAEDGRKRMTKQHKQMIKSFRVNEQGKLDFIENDKLDQKNRIREAFNERDYLESFG